MTSLEGTTYILAADPEFQLMGQNDINEPTCAALAASNGELFLRTWKHLHCIR